MKAWHIPLLILLALVGCAPSDPVDGVPYAPNGGGDGPPLTLDAGVAPITFTPGTHIILEDDPERTPRPPRLTPNYFVLAPAGWAAAAEAWVAYRESKGYEAAWIQPGADQTETLEALRAAMALSRAEQAKAPLFVLILGAEEGPFAPAPCVNDYGECYTDDLYELDDDTIVGRVPARDPQQALDYLDKIRAHEAEYRPGEWNRRLILQAGGSGFHAQIDELLENLVINGVLAMDHGFDIVAAYNDINSPFFALPFGDKVTELINEGGLLSVYIGLAGSRGADGLDLDNVNRISCRERPPFHFFFGSSTGAYFTEEPNIAEALLWRPRGPLTVLGASGTSHTYGDIIWPYELQREAFGKRPDTIGEALILTRRAVAHNFDEFRDLALSSATFVGLAEYELTRALSQHRALYNLYGDPATDFQAPPLNVQLALVEGGLGAGYVIVEGRVRGMDRGRARLSLEVERDVVLNAPEPLHALPVSAREAEEFDYEAFTQRIEENWAGANDRVLVEGEVEFESGRFRARITTGAGLLEVPHYIKVLALDDHKDAVGSLFIPW